MDDEPVRLAPRCARCRWFHRIGPMDMRGASKGECRHGGPILLRNGLGGWPEIASLNWCRFFEEGRKDG